MTAPTLPEVLRELQPLIPDRIRERPCSWPAFDVTIVGRAEGAYLSNIPTEYAQALRRIRAALEEEIEARGWDWLGESCRSYGRVDYHARVFTDSGKLVGAPRGIADSPALALAVAFAAALGEGGQ